MKKVFIAALKSEEERHEKEKAASDKFKDTRCKKDYIGEHQGIASGSVAWGSQWLKRNFSLSLTDRD